MSVKVYEREGLSPEEWRRLCKQHGEDPDAEVINVWENTEAVRIPHDNTTVCGRPGVAISGYALVCAECWGLIQSGKPPRVCEPWDDESTPPEERYDELLRAARMLFDVGVTDEEEIIPTLVWVAKSCELDWEREITKLFANVEEGTEEWEELRGRFAGALGAFEPVRVIEGILILRWVPVAVVGVPDDETGFIKAITIDVRRRSVKPEDVGGLYDKYLRREGIPSTPARSSISVGVSNGYFRITVRPDGPGAFPLDQSQIDVRSEQQTFPSPQFVESNFRELKGSMGKREGFVFTLAGREKGGSTDPENGIPAICAWYLGRRGKLIKQSSLKPGVARILNRDLLEPCGKIQLPEDSWHPGYTVWSTIKVVDSSILRAEHEVREAEIALKPSL